MVLGEKEGSLCTGNIWNILQGLNTWDLGYMRMLQGSSEREESVSAIRGVCEG